MSVELTPRGTKGVNFPKWMRPLMRVFGPIANSLMRIGSDKLGLEGRFLHRNERGCQGSSRCLFGCPNEAKQSTTINYLRRD